jgi:hypothetical protein
MHRDFALISVFPLQLPSVDLLHDLFSVRPEIFVATLHDLLMRVTLELFAFPLDLVFYRPSRRGIWPSPGSR